MDLLSPRVLRKSFAGSTRLVKFWTALDLKCVKSLIRGSSYGIRILKLKVFLGIVSLTRINLLRLELLHPVNALVTLINGIVRYELLLVYPTNRKLLSILLPLRLFKWVGHFTMIHNTLFCRSSSLIGKPLVHWWRLLILKWFVCCFYQVPVVSGDALSRELTWHCVRTWIHWYSLIAESMGPVFISLAHCLQWFLAGAYDGHGHSFD